MSLWRYTYSVTASSSRVKILANALKNFLLTSQNIIIFKVEGSLTRHIRHRQHCSYLARGTRLYSGKFLADPPALGWWRAAEAMASRQPVQSFLTGGIKINPYFPERISQAASCFPKSEHDLTNTESLRAFAHYSRWPIPPTTISNLEGSYFRMSLKLIWNASAVLFTLQLRVWIRILFIVGAMALKWSLWFQAEICTEIYKVRNLTNS